MLLSSSSRGRSQNVNEVSLVSLPMLSVTCKYNNKMIAPGAASCFTPKTDT